MNKTFFVLFCILFLVHNTVVLAKQEAPNEGVQLFKSTTIAKKSTNQPFLEQLMKHSLEYNDIQYIKVENNSGFQRVFSINDGFQERVLQKIIYWLNNSDRVNGRIVEILDNPSNKLTLQMANNEWITIEPAYVCVANNNRKICTAIEGELIVTDNSEKLQIKSQSIYDWLMVGWRKELDGPTKEELLEEALYSRYLEHLGSSYSEFFMCPKIIIEPIDGDPRRHLILASALNYPGHHGGDTNKLTFSVSDSNRSGLQVTDVKIEKHISREESQKQCRTFD